MKRRARYVIATGLVTSLTTFSIALACECLYAGPFLIASRDAPVIVRGKVLRHLAHGLDLDVIEVYRGEIQRTVLRIWGSDGRNCRQNADKFPDESEWIFALRYVGDLTLTGETPTDLEISSCGEHAVQVVDGIVTTFDELGRERRVILEEISIRF